jgi:hypothetical protein
VLFNLNRNLNLDPNLLAVSGLSRRGWFFAVSSGIQTVAGLSDAIPVRIDGGGVARMVWKGRSYPTCNSGQLSLNFYACNTIKTW